MEKKITEPLNRRWETFDYFFFWQEGLTSEVVAASVA